MSRVTFTPGNHAYWGEPPRTYVAATRFARARQGEWIRLPGDYPPATADSTRATVSTILNISGKWRAATTPALPDDPARAYIWIKYIGERP